MMVYRRGASLGPRSLGGVLRDRWETLRENRQRSIDKRKARNIPLTDDPPCEECGRPAPDLQPLPEYDGDPGLDTIRVEFKACRKDTFEELSKAWDEAPDREQAARVLAESLIAITGLEDPDSPIELNGGTDETLDVLEDNKLMSAVILAWGHLQSLEGDARKNCGASQPSTSGSPDTTATRARLPAEKARAATEAATLASGEETATPGSAPTPPGPVPAAS